MSLRKEIRRDYLVDRWVIFAPQRSKRPSDFAVPRTKAKPKFCPFCPGHEYSTPPARLLYIQEGTALLKLKDMNGRRRSDWRVRCIPNLYAALSEPSGHFRARAKSGVFPYVKQRAVGVHEILIESPAHDDHPHRASQRQIELWLQAGIERISRLASKKESASVVLFRNHGREAGASIAHAHSQILTTPITPVRIEQERDAFKKFRDETGQCAMCRIRASESSSERKVMNNTDFTVFTPWASVFPFEFWIVPKRHSGTIVDLLPAEVENLAKVIRQCFSGLAKLVSDPPYNSVFHLMTPGIREPSFHWHIEVYPKLSVQAGFELGSGMYINTLKPEAAAEALASASKTAV